MKAKKFYLTSLAIGMVLINIDQSRAQTNISFTNQNVFLGGRAGALNTTGISNVFAGSLAGAKNSTGTANVFIGSQAGTNNTDGQGNMFIGQQAGANNTNGSYNLFIGNGSGNATINGTGNTAIGDGSFLRNTTGQGNTSIGQYAGINMTTGSNNTFIGLAATAPTGSGALSNVTVLGANALVTASNSVILGNNANVGIGNTAPNNKLEITQGNANQSGLRLTNLTSNSPASLLNRTKFLTVNESGDVVLASLNGTARLGAELWEANGSNVQTASSAGVVIGSGVSKMPAGYKLFVEDGILTEKVKVAVKNTSEWSDKVFDADYRLKSLTEVQDFIKINKHLPGIPSAKEMVEQGNDLHQTDAKLLEKIEELTLYMISVQKRVSGLERENKLLKRKLNAVSQKKNQ